MEDIKAISQISDPEYLGGKNGRHELKFTGKLHLISKV